MAKRPELKWKAPPQQSEARTSDEVEVFDAMLSLQTGGNHVRIMLQTLARKKRGAGSRRFYTSTWYDSASYGDLELDENQNPVIRFGGEKGVYNRKSGGYTYKYVSDGMIRFEQDGIFIQAGSLNNWDSKVFLSNVIDAYTDYKSGGYYMNGWTATTSPLINTNSHKPIGAAVTALNRTMCKDPKCSICVAMKPVLDAVKQFNKDIKDLKNQPQAGGLPAKITSFKKGYLLPYSRPDEHPDIMEKNFKRIKVTRAK